MTTNSVYSFLVKYVDIVVALIFIFTVFRSFNKYVFKILTNMSQSMLFKGTLMQI